jgi:hypothetical protein
MGRVYRARQKDLDRTVAVKILPADLALNPDFEERFRREAQALASLDHPHVVAVHDFAVEDDRGFLVMEHVDGTDLRGLLESGLPRERALELLRQLCGALEYAHARGIVHRDVKPENVLVDREGRAKLADFGLARFAGAAERRLTAPAQVLGTLHYMAPEQYEGRDVDARADVYSLGVLAYELLTGGLPVGRFPPPGAGAAVDRAVLRALERDPARRHASVAEFRRALDARGGLRRPLLAGAVAAAVLLAAGLLLLPSRRAPSTVELVSGSWRGTWVSALDPSNRGMVESEIAPLPSGEDRVSVRFMLKGAGILRGEGDFTATREGDRVVLRCETLRAEGRPLKGLWTFSLERQGDRLKGDYEIRSAASVDRGALDQSRSDAR